MTAGLLRSGCGARFKSLITERQREGARRMAKTFRGVDDLRELFVNDIRFLEQF